MHICVLLSHFSCVRLLVTPWTAAYQAPPSMGFSGQEHWSGVPSPSPYMCVILCICLSVWASQVALVVQNLPAKAGDIRDLDLISRLGRSPGGGHGNPLQYFYLENPMDRRAWWATVHRSQRVGHD